MIKFLIKMKRQITLLYLCLTIGSIAHAQTLTWADNIAPLLYKNCTSCHRQGGAAPFSLMTYNEAKNYKTSIHHAVMSGHMPPWPPDTTYSQLARPKALSAKDKQAILDWAIGDAPDGNPAKAPAPPQYLSGSFIKNPDFVVRAPKYTVTSTRDDYRCFPIKSGLSVDKFITQMECIPGNGRIVHHVLIFQDQSNKCFDLDALDTKPGYESFGGIGSNSAQLIGGWVPGSQPHVMPRGMGIRLKANANIVLQVHYAPGSTNQADSTQLLLKLETGALREAFIAPIVNHAISLINGPLFIPANTTKTYNTKFSIANNATIISASPHMHYIGQKIKSWAVTPNNDTIKFIKIDNWDFHWQGTYLFKKAIKIPIGSAIHGEAFYDNTVNNIHQPSSPPKDVSLGESTTDEMLLIYFTFLAYQAGDENIDLEAATTLTGVNDIPLEKAELFCYPNPATSDLNIKFNLKESSKTDIQIFDYQGIMLKTWYNESGVKGENERRLNIADLPNGMYLVKINAANIYGVQYFVKM